MNLSMKRFFFTLSVFIASILIMSCVDQNKKEVVEERNNFTGQDGEIKLVVVDPGHFHASLLQKFSQEQINDSVYVYAPEGDELNQYLASIESYNNRPDNATSWEEIVYTGNDFVNKLLEEKKGNVVILAGNNKRKIDYIFKSINAGYNVLADKPMAINPEGFELLVQAQDSARKHGVYLYDVMTERYDIMSVIGRELINNKELFGEIESGTSESPSIELESVHHFFKEVSGSTLVRPAWFYDVEQQGEGIVDVTNHLIDLVNWICFPDEAIDYKKDVEVTNATHWPTIMTLKDFEKSTTLTSFPDYLQKYVNDSKLEVYANGQINYNVKDKNAAVSVIWNYQAPEGTTDTYNATFKGTNASVQIAQDKSTMFVEQLFIEKNDDIDSESFESALNEEITTLQKEYPYISLEMVTENKYKIVIPVENRKGHEDYFGMVANKYFDFLVKDEIPEWEITNMLTKYYITTKAYQMLQDK